MVSFCSALVLAFVASPVSNRSPSPLLRMDDFMYTVPTNLFEQRTAEWEKDLGASAKSGTYTPPVEFGYTCKVSYADAVVHFGHLLGIKVNEGAGSFHNITKKDLANGHETIESSWLLKTGKGWRPATMQDRESARMHQIFAFAKLDIRDMGKAGYSHFTVDANGQRAIIDVYGNKSAGACEVSVTLLDPSSFTKAWVH